MLQKWLRRSIFVATCILIGSVSKANAGFTFNGGVGDPAGNTDLTFKLADSEVILDSSGNVITTGPESKGVVTKVGEQVFGIFNISSIYGTNITSGAGSSAQPFWNSNGGTSTSATGGQITGYFVATVSSVNTTNPSSPGGDGSANVTFSSTTMGVYYNDNVTYTTGSGPLSQTSPFDPLNHLADWHVNDGTQVLNGSGVQGVDSNASDVQTASAIFSTDLSGNVTGVVTGSSNGYLQALSSSLFVFAADGEDPNGPGNTPGNQTLAFETNFKSSGATLGWALASQDPVQGAYLGLLPEPSSSILFLIGGGTLGLFYRRRRSKKVA
jgi:hypothetical protein